jgi:hypothetical protein
VAADSPQIGLVSVTPLLLGDTNKQGIGGIDVKPTTHELEYVTE